MNFKILLIGLCHRGRRAPRARRVPAEAGTGGFAIVVALALLSFVVLLLLGLSAFVRVESASAETAKKRTLAQANALLGMRVALSELQRTLGPDQRVSANAEIIDGSIGVDPKMRRTVGVWDAAGWNFENPDAEGDFVGWLTSDSVTAGQFELPNQRNYPSAGPVQDSAVSVLLVGERSAGPDSDDWVWAKKITVDEGDSQGEYAFWVSDEGSKARINLTTEIDPSEPVAVRQRQFESPSGFGAGLVGPLAQVPSADLDTANLEGAVDSRQLPLIDALSGLPQHFERSLFHHVTYTSAGLLTDIREAGFKKDLNLLFEQDDSTFFSGLYGSQTPVELKVSDGVRAVEDREYRALYLFDQGDLPFSNMDGMFLIGPNFAILRDHYRLYKSVSENGGGGYAIPAKPTEPRVVSQSNPFPVEYSFNVRAGRPSFFNDNPNVWVGRSRGAKLSPTIIRYEMLYSVQAEPYSGSLQIDLGGGNRVNATHQLYLLVSPILVLWNPYDVAIDFQGFSVHHANAIPMRFDWEVDYGANVQTSRFNEFTDMVGSGRIDWTNGPKFSISEGGALQRLEPGEVKVYSLSDSAPQDFLNASQGFDLAPGFRSTGGFRVGKLLENQSFTYYDPAVASTVSRNVLLLYADPSDVNNPANSRLAVTGQTLINDNWRSQYFLHGFLIHQGQHANRFEVGHDKPGHVASVVQAGAVITTRESIRDDIGDIGRMPEDPAAFYNAANWLDRIDFGVLDMQARPADYTQKPAKLYGIHDPNAWVTTNPWIHNTINDETMLGPFALLADPLPNNQFEIIDHDFDTARAYWGQSFFNVSGRHFVTASQVPRTPLWSLGSLQHASGMGMFAFEPSHVIGSSFAPAMIRQDDYLAAFACAIDGSAKPLVIGDTAYLSNVAVWDKYFFSSIAPEESEVFAQKRSLDEIIDDIPERGLPNSRIRMGSEFSDLRDAILSGTNLRDAAYAESARHLYIDGVFNINSTSVEAWKALLASMRAEAIVHFDPASASEETYAPTGTVLPRSTLPAGDPNELWAGFRDLSDADISALAEEVVSEVKSRGPFMNLASFVNRNLSNDATGLSGALQSAIDRSGINSGYEGALISESAVSGFPNPEAASGPAAAGAAGFLTQGDLLQAIAPLISARSDTFKIRAFGSSLVGVTNERVEAWCEAVVQRVPEYVNGFENDALDLPDSLSIVNREFGRRFQIVSFRWLGEDEI